jgi:hypothetical protein
MNVIQANSYYINEEILYYFTTFVLESCGRWQWPSLVAKLAILMRGGLNNTNFMAGSEFGDKKRGDIAREHCIILIF